MRNPMKSLLVALTVCFAMMFLVTVNVSAARLYLDPDTLYLTDAVGDTIDLELRVDAATVDLSFFKVYFNFDRDVLDTVSVTEGPLFPSAGGVTFFGAYLINEDTVLQIEDFILGGAKAVDGPGVLASISLQAIAAGKVELSVISHSMRDIGGNPIVSDAGGFTAFIDYPPEPFVLLAPSSGSTIHKYPRDSVELSWQSTASVYPGENVTFRLDYGTSATFEPGATTTVTGLTGTKYYLQTADLSTGTYYWRVAAVGDIHGYERLSDPESAEFNFVLENPTAAFSLIYPSDGGTVGALLGEYVHFDWQASSSVYPGEGVQYTWELSSTPTFSPGTVTTVSTGDTSHAVLADDLDEITYYWRVTAVGDTYGYERESTPWPSSFTFTFGMTEPDPFDLITPTDSVLIDIGLMTEFVFDWQDAGSSIPSDTMTYELYLGPSPSFPGSEVLYESTEDVSEVAIEADSLPLAIWEYWTVEATNKVDLSTWASSTNRVMFYILGDLNSNRKINLADISKMIDVVYLSKIPAVPERCADVNCDTKVNLADISKLIAFVYLNGDDLYCP